MQHAITVGDLLWWGGAAALIILLFLIVGAVITMIGRGFSR